MTDTKIVAFPGSTTPDQETKINEECKKDAIEILEQALKEAQAGKIACCGVAVVRPNGGINSASSDTNDCGRLLGAVSLLHYRLLEQTDDGATVGED